MAKLASLLEDIEGIIGICKNTTHSSSRLYMRSSTYLKLGAVAIAKKENSIIKRAINFSELEGLENDMNHYDEDFVQMHLDISSCTDVSDIVDRR